MAERSPAGRKALVISYHVGGPDRDSGSRRLHHLTGFLLESGWQVSFLASDGAGRVADVLRLQALGVPVHDAARERIEDVLAAVCPDLVLIAFWRNAERYLPVIRETCPDARILVDSVDLHFLRESRRAFGAGSETWLGLGRVQAADYARELGAYAGSDGVMTVSQKEADLVADLLWDDDRVRAVPDFEAIEPSTSRWADRRGMVILGSFEHPPNVEATAYLFDDILPLVDRALLREHPLLVIGNGLDERIRRMGAGHPDVRMVGWVPDVEPYLGSARISLVPLLHGAGTKRKLIQALAVGTPTVSTSIGTEGLDLASGEHVLVADDAATFAQAMERLLTDEELWERLRLSGISLVARTNGLDRARQAFDGAVDAVMARDPRRIVPLATGHRRIATRPADRAAENVTIVQKASAILPPGSRVALVTDEEAGLLDLPECRVWSVAAMAGDAQLAADALDERVGSAASASVARATHVIIPVRASGLLDSDRALRRTLEESFRAIHRDESFVLLKATDRGSAPRGATNGGTDVRLIAFYLPQFHPIPENDQWWGRGFTEWRHVARARPLFEGHEQPHVPADLGFYDLRLEETRIAQADLARAHGIHGFCYYHYWFGGQRLLERPFDEVLASGTPDLPFCLAWVNESWTRRWSGREDDVLIRQGYSSEDDLAHIRALLPALADPRAITVDGRPMFLVWRARSLPDAPRTTDLWREEVHRAGLPGLHLVAMETAWDLGWDATQVGFDAKVLFQPQFGWLLTDATRQGTRIDVPGAPELEVYDYDRVREALRGLPPVSYRRYETVFPGWDNTARRGKEAVIVHGSTPLAYEAWLREAVERERGRASTDPFAFVNAWNEWAEGCHLEPDRRHGRAYLEATKRALDPSVVPDAAATLVDARGERLGAAVPA